MITHGSSRQLLMSSSSGAAASVGGMGGNSPARNSQAQVVELFVSCRELINADFMSKSDPFVVVFYKSELEFAGKWVELGRTETVDNSLNPNFVTQIRMDFFFEEVQELLFWVFDRDSSSEDLKKHDFLGECKTTLSRIMGSHGSTFSTNLTDKAANTAEQTRRKPKDRGKLIIKGDQVSDTKSLALFQARGSKLERKNWFGLGKSDPFLSAWRTNEDGSFLKVWESNVKKGDLSPQWSPSSVAVQVLCNGDLDRPLLFRIEDWERNGSHKPMGEFTASVSDIVNGKRTFDVLHSDPKKRAKGHTSGQVEFTEFKIEEVDTLLDYIQGGCEIELSVAIDFTASNGTPSDPRSLHYMSSQTGPNAYEQAISAVGSILEEYDTDKRFPVYGFGAKMSGKVNHCLPLTFDETHPEVDGVQGILNVYRRAFEYCALSGPTLFAPLLRQVAGDVSQCSQHNQKYTVLLIITDGTINDMDATIDQIVEATHLPLSIVIVGVGQANFDGMEELDADDAPLRHSISRKYMERDIVQFVPMRNFSDHQGARLARETLAEIPSQLLSYMKKHGIKPNARTDASTRHFAGVPSNGGNGSISGPNSFNNGPVGGSNDYISSSGGVSKGPIGGNGFNNDQVPVAHVVNDPHYAPYPNIAAAQPPAAGGGSAGGASAPPGRSTAF